MQVDHAFTHQYGVIFGRKLQMQKARLACSVGKQLIRGTKRS